MKLNEILNENVGKFLTDINEIEAWLVKMKIKNYTINNGVVDVAGDVKLGGRRIEQIPIQFGKVTGNFNCDNNQLTSLAGCPTHVGGNFGCDFNQLTSLEGCPTRISGYFYCNGNQLTSLEGGPAHISGGFDCSNNQLISLVECPSEVSGNFYCRGNKLTSHTIGLILTGCDGLDADGDWKKIIEKYLGRPDDIFECQAELIENGFEDYALL